MNPYFGNTALSALLEVAPPDKKVRELLRSNKIIEYKPTRSELALWKIANFNGAGIDPKRPFENVEDDTVVRKCNDTTRSNLLLLMQAMLCEGNLPKPEEKSPELKTQDEWEFSIYHALKEFLVAVGDCFVETKPIPDSIENYGEKIFIEPPLLKSVEYFPDNYWFRLFHIRYLSLRQETSLASERVEQLRSAPLYSQFSSEKLGNEHAEFHEILAWERELTEDDLSTESINAISRILKNLSKKALSERSNFSDSPHLYDPWEHLDFNDEHLFHYLRSLLYQSGKKCKVPGRFDVNQI